MFGILFEIIGVVQPEVIFYFGGHISGNSRKENLNC